MNIDLSNILRQKSYIYLALSVLFLVILMLSPMLNSGYTSDDSLNSLTKGYLLERNESVSKLSYDQIMSWITIQGRFFPLAFYVFWFNSIIPNLLVYKFIILLFIALNIALFGYFINIITGEKYLGILAISLAPIFLQMRLSPDAILGFPLLMQLVFLYFISSLILFTLYLKNLRSVYLILSLLLYIIDLLTYEIVYPFFLLYFVMAYFNAKNKNMIYITKLALPFALSSSLFILIAIFLRLYFKISLVGKYGVPSYMPNPSLNDFIMTIIKQISAAFPLSYYIIDPHSIFEHGMGDLGNFVSIGAISIGIAYFVIYVHCSNMIIREESLFKRNAFGLNQLIFIGLSLLVLPAVIISLSPKYQMELVWGTGHIPVYISYFGLIMITTSIVCMIYDRFNKINKKSFKIISLAFALLFVILAEMTYCNNINVIENSNSNWLYPRDIVEKSMENGLFELVPNGSILLVDSHNPWDRPAFYRMHLGPKFNSILISAQGSYWSEDPNGYISDLLPKDGFIREYKNKYLYNFSDTDNIFYLKYDSNSAKEGYVILGRVKDLSISKDDIYGATTKSAFVYLRYPSLRDPYPEKSISLAGHRSNSDTNSFEPFMLREEDMDLVSSGKGWKLFSIDGMNEPLDIMSLSINVNSYLIKSSILENDNLILKRDMNEVLHIGFKYGFIDKGVEFEPVSMNESFTIEIILKPFNDQVSYADIIGNHPGYNGPEGFVVQQDDNNTNTYYYSFGNGKDWSHPIKFKLKEGEMNYLAIIMERNRISIYDNGLILNSSEKRSFMVNSQMPLYIGNWVNKNRPFNGAIKEIKITNNSLSKEDIALNWRSIQHAIQD